MIKRILTLAVILAAFAGLAAPTQAETVLNGTGAVVSFFPKPPATDYVNQLTATFDFNVDTTKLNLTNNPGNFTNLTYSYIGTNELVINFDPMPPNAMTTLPQLFTFFVYTNDPPPMGGYAIITQSASGHGSTIGGIVSISVPEPASMGMMGLGIAGLALFHRAAMKRKVRARATA